MDHVISVMNLKGKPMRINPLTMLFFQAHIFLEG